MASGSPRDGRSLEQQIAEDEVREIEVNERIDTGSGVEKFLNAEDSSTTGQSTTNPGFSVGPGPGFNSLGTPACRVPSRTVKPLTEKELAGIPKSPRKLDYSYPTLKDPQRPNQQPQS